MGYNTVGLAEGMLLLNSSIQTIGPEIGHYGN
jgi:hypothetical protein